MKKLFTLCFFILLTVLYTSNVSAQNIYWGAGQGFNNVDGGSINSTSSLIPAGPAADTADGGTIWVLYNAYRTSSTPSACPVYQSGHIRFPKVAEESWMTTPDLAFGVNTISFATASTSAGKVYTLQYTTGKYDDTAAYAVAGATWTTISEFKISTGCGDTTVTLNLLPARRIRWFIDSIASGTPVAYQTDIDSVLITSINVITPVTFGGISAVESNGVVKVDWSILTELNAKEYIVERSADGVNFSPIGTLNANGASNYVWLDNSPLDGNASYKVEALDVNGNENYSTVVEVSTDNKLQGVIINPNPVINGQLNVQLNNLAVGNYALDIYSTIGQKVSSSIISYTGGSYSKTILLPSTLAKGLYNVHVTNGFSSINKGIIVE